MAGCCTASRKKQGQFWEEAERGVEQTDQERTFRVERKRVSSRLTSMVVRHMMSGYSNAGIQLQVTQRIRLHNVIAAKEWSNGGPDLSGENGPDARVVLLCLAVLHGLLLVLLPLQDEVRGLEIVVPPLLKALADPPGHILLCSICTLASAGQVDLVGGDGDADSTTIGDDSDTQSPFACLWWTSCPFDDGRATNGDGLIVGLRRWSRDVCQDGGEGAHGEGEDR